MMAASMNDMQDMSMSPDIKVTRNCHDDNHEIIMMTIMIVHGDDQRTVDTKAVTFIFSFSAQAGHLTLRSLQRGGSGKRFMI